MKSVVLPCGVIWIVIMTGCASSGTAVRYVDPNKTETLTADFGATDLHMISKSMISSLVMSPVLDGRPVLFVDVVKNKTHEHIDTKAITNTIRTELLRAGKARVTGRSDIESRLLQEQEFQQSDMADPQTVVKMGKIAGANFILSGEITSIVKKSGRKQDIWFKVTLNLSDVQSGLIEWADEKEINKEAVRSAFGYAP